MPVQLSRYWQWLRERQIKVRFNLKALQLNRKWFILIKVQPARWRLRGNFYCTIVGGATGKGKGSISFVQVSIQQMALLQLGASSGITPDRLLREEFAKILLQGILLQIKRISLLGNENRLLASFVKIQLGTQLTTGYYTLYNEQTNNASLALFFFFFFFCYFAKLLLISSVSS